MEGRGLWAALLSSALGGTAVVATRYLTAALDPLMMGAVRFGGGFLVLLFLALGTRDRWPKREDWPGTSALGVLFFGLFPVLFNASLAYTTAARGALALSTLPLLTMAAGAVLRVEAPSWRKLIGVLVAMGGVAVALGASLATAPPGAWRGDLLMVAAAFCMALYNVWSRPFVLRSGPIPFAAFGMGVGAACLLAICAARGSLAQLALLDAPQWIASVYLALVCGAFIFFLWALALGRTAPTLVAISVAVNPVAAALLAVPLLGEPVSGKLLIGLLAVILGIGIASGVVGRVLAIGRSQP